MTIDTTAILTACVGGAGMLIALAVGWYFGAKTAFAVILDMARRKLSDAEYAEFAPLLHKVRNTV